MHSPAEENYIKAVYKITAQQAEPAGTNALAEVLQTTAASVTDMLKRLSAKGLVVYTARQGCTLSETGRRLALQLLRKHRLWETFLFEKLDFSWDEVHELAEQLEHIQSDELINRLDAFLGCPQFDPHGDPIPDADGRLASRHQLPLASLPLCEPAVIVGVGMHDPAFLQYLDYMGLRLGTRVEVLECFSYDLSLRLALPQGEERVVSHKVAQHLLVSG